MNKLTQGATRLLVLALGLGLVTTVWAVVPVPTVVWESGEFESSKTGTDGQTYSISRNNLHTINGSGNIVIGEGAQGVTINLPSNPSDSVSVLVKYSSTTTAPVANAALATIYMSAQYDIGAIVGTSGSSSVNGYYSSATRDTPQKADYSFSNGLTLSQGSGVMLLSHGIDPANTVRGTAFYTGATVSSMTAGGNVAGLQWTHKNGTRTISCVAIGGPTRNNVGVKAWNGMVIEKIAVFVDGYYTGTELADYRWPSEIKAVLPERDMINLNISNGDGYAITGSGVDTISTLAGEMLDNAWQNTPSGNAVVSGDARNGRVTGVTAYDGTSKEAITLSNVMFTWAVEGSGTANYGYQEIENNPTFHKAWLARYSKAAETSSILVQSIPYRKYDIIVYCFGADDSAFNPVFVNGVPYVGDTSLATDTNTRKATSSSETWGGRRALPSLGQAAIMLKGLENPELSLTIRSGATSICAVQILRDMSEDVWPTSKKVISLNFMSARGSSGTTPAIYGLEPVPDAAWTKDGLSSITSSGADVTATIMEWNGSAAVEASGVTVNEKAANAHGWSGYTYAPQNQILSDYLDDGGNRATITVTGVPYSVYDVIVYTATDTENRQFGPVKVNDVPYRWDDNSGEVVVADSADSTATTRWGASRSRLPAYGRNAIRIPNQTSSTLTIAGANNDNSARGCIAAIQIVEAHSGLKVYSNGSWSGGAEPTSGDAIIVVDGDTTLAIDGTASLDTVIITGTGTLTLSGSGKFTATTIEVESLATVNANPDRLDATTYVGSGTVVYSGGTPETGKGWTDSANWTGTVEIKGKASTTPTLKFADYGNSESAVCVNGFEAYISLDEGVHAVKEIKIGPDGFTQAGSYGYNATKDFVIPAKLTGGGTYTVYMTDNATKTTYFTGDVSEFSGAIAFNANTESSRVVIGESTSRTFENKSVVIGANGVFNVKTIWYPAGTVYVDQTGEFNVNLAGYVATGYGIKIDGLASLYRVGYNYANSGSVGTGTPIIINETGLLVVKSTGDVDDRDYVFSVVEGTGTIRYNGSGWRTLSSSGMFADTLSLELEQASGVVIAANNLTVGSVSGTKNLRSDLDSSDKTFTIKQAKDGVWSGAFEGGGDRLATVIVDQGASSIGTLTIAGTHTHDNALTVNGSVNLTGTWVGATTVSGTFGGTGTLTGNLTFSNGATFKVYDGSDPIAVSGTVTFPTADGETATIDLTGVTLDPAGTTLISGTTSIGAIDKVSANGAILKVESGALKAYPVAALTKADDSVVTYPTAQAAVNATPYNSGYKYVTIYQSNVSVTMVDTSLKLKLADGVTGVTVSNPFDEFAISSSTESGVTTYTLANNPTVYTWDSGTSIGVWNSMVVAPWRYSKNDTPTQANRAPASGDDVIFASGASVTVGENISVDSITNSAALTFTKSSSDVTITAASGGIVLTDAAASITVTGVTLSPTPTTTVANSYVKLADSTYSVQAYVTVTIPEVANATAAVTVDGVAATGSSPYTVDVGSNVEITWTADSGYKITDGATQTINSIAANTTADIPTVEAMGATVSNVNFSYGADYATARVTATVSGDATSATLNYGNAMYNANVVDGTVTFENVAVTRGNDIYAEAGYTITVKDGATPVTATGGEGTTVAADVVAADWINERAASATGTSASALDAGGAWTNAVTYTDGTAAISDNRFAATTASTASRVVLEFEVCFSSTSEDDVSGEAQAAIKLGAVNDATTFMVLTTGNTWTPVSNAELPIDASATYDVVLAIDYGTSTYKVDVEGKSLTNSAGVASFSLATNKAAVQNIDFVGSGTLTSMKGDQIEGYMVVDKNGTRYASISAAITAYLADPTIAPLRVLHDGTAPSGWKIVTEGGVDILKKIAKGLFFMAY